MGGAASRRDQVRKASSGESREGTEKAGGAGRGGRGTTERPRRAVTGRGHASGEHGHAGQELRAGPRGASGGQGHRWREGTQGRRRKRAQDGCQRSREGGEPGELRWVPAGLLHDLELPKMTSRPSLTLSPLPGFLPGHVPLPSGSCPHLSPQPDWTGAGGREWLWARARIRVWTVPFGALGDLGLDGGGGGET